MKRRSSHDSAEIVRNKLIGLGENSMRKSYYPELRDRIYELERFRALVEHANDAFFVLDVSSWCFADVNATALKKTNFLREEMLEKSPESIFPKETCEFMRAVGSDSESSSVHRNEDILLTELLGKNDIRVPVEITVRVHVVGGITYLVMVARDVTRKLADQRELQKTRNYLGNVIDSIQSILVGINEESKVVLWNALAVEETAVAEKDALGRYIFDVMPEIRKFKQLISRAIQNEETGETEVFTVEHSGETVFFEIAVFPFKGEGEAGAVIRIDNITDRTRMEEVMVQTEKMMTVGGLAAGMAHEINNPLGGILQGSQNILRRLSSDLEINHKIALECGTTFDAIYAYCKQRGIISKVESIQQLGERSAKIVANMLQFSRQTDGKQDCASLVDIVNTAIELSSSGYELYQTKGHKGVHVIREFDDYVPDIFCASSEIEQVIINIIKNSAQAIASAIKEGENKVGKIYVRIRREENYIRLEIEDNGPGMDAETKKKSLEPFFTTKGIGEGTGLGLFVSYFIITQKHKGSFGIETSPMLGTKIIIKLPVAYQCLGLD